jgi:hypothetical protein
MKWEYMITTFGSTREWVIEELNRLGEEEWEAIAVTSDGHILMKRPKGTRSDSDAKRPALNSWAQASSNALRLRSLPQHWSQIDLFDVLQDDRLPRFSACHGATHEHCHMER